MTGQAPGQAEGAVHMQLVRSLRRLKDGSIATLRVRMVQRGPSLRPSPDGDRSVQTHTPQLLAVDQLL